MATRYIIHGGPSRFDLMLALFDARNHQIVTFTVRPEDPGPTEYMEVGINQIGQEDGSGESWIFEGYLKSDCRKHVKGYFRTDRRQGHLEVA